MQRRMEYAFVWSALLFVFFYLISKLFNPLLFEHLLSAAALVNLLVLLPFLRGRDAVLPVFLISCSFVVWAVRSSDPVVLWQGLREMKEVIPTILLVPLMGWIISHKPYIQALLSLWKGKRRNHISLFALAALVAHLISSFMYVGAIPFVYRLFQGSRPNNKADAEAWEFTISTAILRGVVLTAFWAATHPAFAYGVSGGKLDLFPFIVKGLGLTAVGLLLGLLVYTVQFKLLKMPIHFQLADSGPRNGRETTLIADFLLWMALMIGMILFLYRSGMGILTAIPIMILTLTAAYFLVNRAMSQYLTLWNNIIRKEMITKRKEMAVLLSTGVFISVLKQTEAGDALFQYFLSFVEWLNFDLFIALTLMVVALGFIGLTPIPAMVLITGFTANLSAEYPYDLVVLSLLLGVAVTLIVAPVTVTLLLMSGANGKTMHRNGFAWNYWFGAAFIVAGQIYLHLIR